MKQSFVTVFQTSYFSNGYLPILILCALAGLIVALVVLFKRDSSGKRFQGGAKMIFLGFWIPVWLFVFVLAVGMLISYGHKYTRALVDGRCDIVEGPVLLIRQQPKSGARLWLQSPKHASLTSTGYAGAKGYLAPPATNAPGDIVKVGDREFVMNFYSLGLGYQQTAAHGGVLTNGAYARLHYLGNTIVKVEVRQ
jgi:hypothetical protein